MFILRLRRKQIYFRLHDYGNLRKKLSSFLVFYVLYKKKSEIVFTVNLMYILPLSSRD